MRLVTLFERLGKLRGNGLPFSLIVTGLFLIFEALFVDHAQAHTAVERIPASGPCSVFSPPWCSSFSPNGWVIWGF